MKYVLMILCLTSCGWINRQYSAVTGDVVEICHQGVLYGQFISGASVLYDQSGKVLRCGDR
jgi:hypothetical protein